MEWEKPRVFIPAARGARVGSGAYTHARPLSGSSGTVTGSVLIRAPLTIDDDDTEDEDEGSDFESSGSKSASNYVSSHSSVIDSGTDEGFESASADTDEETAGEDSILGGTRVYRPVREDPGVKTFEATAFNVRSKVYRSSVGELDEETSVNYSSFGEEESESGSEVHRVSPKARIVIPRARLSLDDDEVDQELDSEDEMDGFTGVFEGPSTRTVARVKCPGIAGGEEEEEEIEDQQSEVGESTLVDKLEFLGSVSGVLVYGDAETVGMNYSDTGSVSLEVVEERSFSVVQRDCAEMSVGSDITSVQLTEKKAVQGNSFEETVCASDSSTHELGSLIISDEGSIGSGSGELGGNEVGNMIGEAENFRGNDCGIVGELGKPECRTESGSVMWNYETFRMNPTVESESEKEAKQDLKGINRNSVLPDEDVSCSGFNPVAMADKTVENEEQISKGTNHQFALENDGQANEISVKAADRLLLSDEVEIVASGSSTITSDEKEENEEEMARLIHDLTFTEFDEYEATTCRRELLDYNSQHSSEESSSEHFTGHLGQEKEEERIAKIQLIRSKLLRLIRTLGLSADDAIASEILAKLDLASGEHEIVHGFYTESKEMKTMNLKGEVSDDVDFSVNILVIGKTGVGKSATINSIFGETKSPIGAFGPTTKSTRDIIGDVGGIKIRLLDTPGLRSSAAEERVNRKVLLSIKKRMKRLPVDIVLYIDRLDQESGNINDIQMLRSITRSLGSSIWRNAIVVLTHAASSIVPDSSYSDLVARRSVLLQNLINLAVRESSYADLNVMPRLILAENNKNSFLKNESGECMFLSWRQQLLLLCGSAKIMSEAGFLQKQETQMEKSKLFDPSLDSISLFHSLWNLLIHGSHPRLVSNSRNELELSKASFSDSLEQKKAHFDEHRCLEKKQQEEKIKTSSESEESPGNEGKNTSLEERRSLGVRAKAGGKRFVVCFDTFHVKTGISLKGGSRTSFSVRNDDKREGQMLLKMRGLEQMQIAAFSVLPLVISLFRHVYDKNTQKNSK